MSTTRKSRVPCVSNISAVASRIRRRVCAARRPSARPSRATAGSATVNRAARSPRTPNRRSRVKIRPYPNADTGLVGIEFRERRDHSGALLVEIDDGNNERDTFVERRHAVLTYDGEGVHRREAGRGDPLEGCLAAVATKETWIVLMLPTVRAMLDTQLAPSSALPELSVFTVWPRPEILRALAPVDPVMRDETGHDCRADGPRFVLR